MALATVKTKESLRDAVQEFRRRGERVALVPTMGALHAGHISLIERAKSLADRVIASIFVNPAQFGPEEDFNRYPRQLERDRVMLNQAGADVVYVPDVAEMYPEGFSTVISLHGPASELEGAHRPGHFDGVATVVAKLLLRAAPDVALFGEKDYQQLCVIRRMVQDVDIPVEIVGVPTLREADGLALSSRNVYLTEGERAIAPLLYRMLQEVADVVRCAKSPGEPLIFSLARRELLSAGFSEVDYLSLRDAETFERVSLPLFRPARLLTAARIGSVRLIDNVEVAVG